MSVVTWIIVTPNVSSKLNTSPKLDITRVKLDGFISYWMALMVTS